MTAQTLDEQNDASAKYTAADVLDPDGYPKGSNGGKDSVNAGDYTAPWRFEPDSNLGGEMTLILYIGTFDFSNTTVNVPVKFTYRGFQYGGTFTKKCYCDSPANIRSGLFLNGFSTDGSYSSYQFSRDTLRTVNLEGGSGLSDLHFAVNGIDVGNTFSFVSYDPAPNYGFTAEVSRLDFTITCTGTDADKIKGWQFENTSASDTLSGIINKSTSYNNQSSSPESFITVSCQNGSPSTLNFSTLGRAATRPNITLTALTVSDPNATYKATVPCATLYTEDDTGARQPLTDTSKVKPGTKVYIEYDETAAKEQYGEGFIFNGWKLTGSVSLGDDANLTDESGWFTMPDDDVTLELIVPDPDVPGENPGDSSGVSPDGVAGAIVAGAVIGATGYAAVTHIWLDSIFGFVPANRQQLALALWEKADKPQPQSSTLYSDISDKDADAQAAARWCTEQGLMKDFDEDFKPGRYVFRLQAIKAWNDLQAQLKADK